MKVTKQIVKYGEGHYGTLCARHNCFRIQRHHLDLHFFGGSLTLQVSTARRRTTKSLCQYAGTFYGQ